MFVERGRTTHRLTRVVYDEIESVIRREQLPAERLDAWRVPEIEPIHLHAITPILEIRLGREPAPGLREGIRTLEIVEKIYRQSGYKVSVAGL